MKHDIERLSLFSVFKKYTLLSFFFGGENLAGSTAVKSFIIYHFDEVIG